MEEILDSFRQFLQKAKKESGMNRIEFIGRGKRWISDVLSAGIPDTMGLEEALIEILKQESIKIGSE